MSGGHSEDDFSKVRNEIGNWENDLNQFIRNMRNKIIRNIFRKGYPTKERLENTSDEDLIQSLKEHLELKHYSDVANYAFMLYQKNGEN